MEEDTEVVFNRRKVCVNEVFANTIDKRLSSIEDSIIETRVSNKWIKVIFITALSLFISMFSYFYISYTNLYNVVQTHVAIDNFIRGKQ